MTPDDLTLVEKAALLSGENIWQTRAIPRLGIPAIWLSDGPHGLRKQPGDADHLGLGESEPAVCFPTAATVANSWDEDLAEELGAALGREAAARQVHVLLGPGLNITRDPRGGRNFEYLSEDPELSGRMAAAYVRGIQSQGVAATPKHFAVNSQELRRLVSDSVLDEQTLHELYLTAFEIVVREARPWALMSSYNLVNGEYAHQNRHLLTETLRDTWGFDGAVISDWGGCSDPVAAARAGGTLEMPSPGFGSVRALVQAVESGDLPEADLDARVQEVLTLIDRVQHPTTTPLDSEAHHALARRAAAAGAVLLRNEHAVLPLTATRIALIGELARTPRYQGAGSSLVNPTRLSTLLDCAPVEITAFAPGYRTDTVPDPALVGQAIRAAEDADVVVLALGQPDSVESEGLDRPHLRLPDDQIALLHALHATGTPVVAVLHGGGPVETPWRHLTSALLHAYLGGQAGAEGIWDVLTGTIDPAGRLAVTHPERLADLPTADTFPSDHRAAVYAERQHIGYRSGATPAFPFGYGLTYTTFAYSDLRLGPTAATLTVTNTGTRPGTEVAQLYRRRPDGLHLIGFARVTVETGAHADVRIPYTDRTFRQFDARTHTWLTPGGDHELLAGPHCGDLPLRGTLHLTGGAAVDTPAPIPAAPADWTPGVFDRDTPLDHTRTSRTLVGRALFAYLSRRRRRAEGAAHPDLDALFIYSAPFRVMHTMTGGTLPPEFTDAVLLLVRGRRWAGVRALVRALTVGRRADRRVGREFAGGRPRQDSNLQPTD